jgi:hypothetical protein
LWGVLLKQAPIQAVSGAVVCVAWIVGAALLWRFVKRKTTLPVDTDYEPPRPEWQSDAAVGCAWGLAIAVALIAAMVVAVSFPAIVTALLNPEYWALSQILK